MTRPNTQSGLLEQMNDEFDRLLATVDLIPPESRSEPGACGEWSIKDLLAHLDAWHEMFLGWEEIGSAGEMPVMPAVGYRWSETPALNEAIWLRTKSDSWEMTLEHLHSSYQRVRAVIESYEADALFEKQRYRWTGTTSVGSYAVSATSSHYTWARKLVGAFQKSPARVDPQG